jgi:hypothetical protein
MVAEVGEVIGGEDRERHGVRDRMRGGRTVVKFRGFWAHDAFVRWIHENPQGFVINCRRDYWMLHQADCPCFVFKPDTEVCLTRNPKVCSLDRSELDRWAAKKRKAPLEPCSRRPSRA